MKLLKSFLFVVAIAVLVSACSNSTTPNSITVVQPKTGSTFTFEDVDTDSLTGAVIDSTRDTTRMEVISTGGTFDGKTNVSQIDVTSSTSNDPAYFSYESNGDISMMIPDFGSGMPVWITMPISSRTTSEKVLMDTSYTFFGITVSSKLTVKTEYVGTETMTVKGASLSVVKIRQSLISKTTTAGIADESTSITYFYIAPSLGFFAKVHSESMTVIGRRSEGSISTLFDYELK